MKPAQTLLSAFTLLFILACDTAPTLTTSQSLTPIAGKPNAPAFKLIDMDNEVHKLADYKGKPVIINFWATWCPPCREELPSIDRAWKKVKDDDIEMLAINVGEDKDTIFAFSDEYSIDFTILLNESGKEIHNWPIKGLPTTFIIDPNGKIIYQAVGRRAWDNDRLLDIVRALKRS